VHKQMTVLVSILILSGCICGPKSSDNSTSHGKDSSGILGGLGGLGVGGGNGGSAESKSCKVPPEALGLKLTDCQRMKQLLEKTSCITAVALTEGDPDVCDNIKEDLLVGACVAVIAECKQDESICARLGEKDVGSQYVCESMVAKAKKDESICEGIDNTNYRNPCFEGVAVARGDVALCGRIEDKGDKDDCIVAVAVALPDASLCKRLTGTLDYWQNECLMKVGIVASDMSVCNMIKPDVRGEEEMMQKCMMNVSMSKLDMGECDKITDIEKRDYYCINQIARIRGDIASCDKVSDKGRKNACIGAVAVALKDASICQMMRITDGAYTFPSPLNECVTEIAKLTRNKALCEKAYDKTAKAKCVAEVG